MSSSPVTPRIFTSLGRTPQRLFRYISVWKWLIAYNFNARPGLLFLSLFFGICYRVGTLAGFVLSIRCAAWILKPDTIPPWLADFLPNDEGPLFAVLVAVPGSIFLGIAAAQISQNLMSMRLRNAVAEAMSQQYAEFRLQDYTEENLRDRPTMSALAVDVRLMHGKVITVETLFITLLITVLGFVLALIGGMFIDWYLMTVIAVIGISFATITAVYRHLKSHQLAIDQKAEQDREQKEIEDIVNLSRTSGPDEKIADKIDAGLPALLKTMSSQKSVDQKFINKSTLIIDMGQAAIIVAFLSLLIESSGSDPKHIASLIILALLFRFLSSYLQAITHIVIKLGTYYPFLVTLRDDLEKRSKSP